MQSQQIRIERDNTVVAEPVAIATSVWQRFRGLMLRKALEPGEGVLFPRCSSIHMFFMRFPIDVVYLDADNRVKKIVHALKPWRMSWCPGAKSVLEIEAGRAERTGLQVGDRLVIEEAIEKDNDTASAR